MRHGVSGETCFFTFAVVGVRADGNVARQSPTTQHSAYNSENQPVLNMLLVLLTLLILQHNTQQRQSTGFGNAASVSSVALIPFRTKSRLHTCANRGRIKAGLF